ncbi:MAG: GAF domain-containing protein, partial [Sediminibacterium sp.]
EHLRVLLPELGTFIDGYFEQIDPAIRLKVTHRHEFEESITFINQELARFIDAEQDAAQKIYPHYFERFVTDGVDFNMYIGQSIKPDKPFDTFYLKNLKMWQLTTLTRAARLANSLQTRMSNPLKTTQLILAHSVPISISFRTAERKFDVDGAYNIRYEIIKKRIDKVHVKGSNERLTQPGKLAIVFSQSREAAEYLDYIEFLQNQRMLLHDLEQLELEELQGVVGLKALRVSINMEPDESESIENKPEVIEIVQN